MGITKLDMYESMLVPGVIRITLASTNDAQAVDILSELSRTQDLIFLDGNYYEFLGESRIVQGIDNVYLELQVIQCDRSEILRRIV